MIINDQDRLYAEKYGLTEPKNTSISEFNKMGIVESCDYILTNRMNKTIASGPITLVITNEEVKFSNGGELFIKKMSFDTLFVCLHSLLDQTTPKEYENDYENLI